MTDSLLRAARSASCCAGGQLCHLLESEQRDGAEVCGITAAWWAQRVQQTSRCGIQLTRMAARRSCLPSACLQPALSVLFLCAGVPTLSGFTLL